MTETADTGTLVITVDGRSIDARPGELVIAAAERAGTYIPRFCYHPRMRPVGMCRMCLVEIDTGRGPALGTACTVAVAEGMSVDTESDRVKKAQDGVLEFLLINHPLDCPVCDKGGECPLQDQTLAFGPGESRFVEEKRHFEKPIALSGLVLMDRERCILCDRCTRFGREVSGEPLISFIERGNETEVNTFPEHPFASYFSGNTVQICPVGALTATPYRFKARPWDLDQVESTCTSCAVGCRVAVQSSADAVVRYLGVDVDPVNWGWLCDKGRFDFEAVNSADRLGSPLVRNASEELVEVGWGEALGRAADILTGAGEGGIGVLGGARLTNEDAYAWSKLARTVLNTDSVDAQLGDGLPAEAVLGLPRATIDDACSAGTVVLLAPDLEEELPVLYLRLRHAVVTDGLQVVELSPTATAMTELATVSLRYRPGEAAALVRSLLAGAAGDTQSDSDRAPALRQARSLLGADSVVCVLGRPSLAESAESVLSAAGALLDAVPGLRFLPALRRSNVMGALDMGLAPGLLPGRVALAEGRDWFAAWGDLPAEAGLDTAGMLRAAADGRLAALVLLGADPLADFPDRELARRALVGAGAVVAVDCFVTGSVRLADVALAAAGYAEKTGTTTNIEGRVSRLNAKVSAPGTARPDWVIAAELAHRMGADLGLESVEAIWDEIERLAPSHAGLTGARLASPEGLDGIVAGAPPSGAAGNAPPAMAPADEPAVIAADAHMGPGAVASTTSGGGAPPAPDPGSGAPSGASGEAAGAAGDTADYGAGQPDPSDEAEAVERSVEATHEPDGDDGPADDGSGEGSAEAGAAGRPSLLRWAPADGSAAPAAPAPTTGGEVFRLVSSRRLYDAGTLVQHSPSLAALALPLPVRLHPADLARLGVEQGSEVRVSSRRGSVVLETMGDPTISRGTASITFNNQPGPGAADLIDADADFTDVRIDTRVDALADTDDGDSRG